jgi:hypothetical protein
MPMEKGQADGSCPFVTDDGYLIVARFGPEGKPDHAWKSRIFNNLGCIPTVNVRVFAAILDRMGLTVAGCVRSSSLWNEAGL